VNAANPAAFNAGQTLPFEPGKIPATLGVVSMTTPAFPLGYSYQKDFQLPGNKNKKIAIKSDSKEWNFYFRQANDNSSQPRFRIWLENSVKITIWGNLQLGPGFRHVCVPEQAGHDWNESCKAHDLHKLASNSFCSNSVRSKQE
jgi:hypothetical protein